MKKFIIFAISAIFCVALAMPAAAGQVKVGGSVALDMYYFDQDSARQAGGVPLGGVPAGNGFGQTVIELPWAFTNINVSYTNDDKSLGAYVEVRDGFFAGAENLVHNIDQAFVWWKINPMIQFTFGRKASIVSPYNPWVMMGTGHAFQKGAGSNWGNMFNAPGRDQFLTTFTLSDMFSIELAIVDPGTRAVAAPDPLVAALGSTGTENEIPRIDLAMPLNFGAVKLVPSFTYLAKAYDEVVPGNADDLDVWMVSLAAMASFGPVTFTGEIQAGENLDLAVSNFPGGAGALPTTYGPAGAVRIADASYVGYWADLAFKFGKVTFHGIIGGSQVDSDGDPAVPQDLAEYDATRTMYGITVPIMVAPAFWIGPEIMFYDYGNDNERNVKGWNVFDDGEERVFGVQLKLMF